jgi:hypothetical protein
MMLSLVIFAQEAAEEEPSHVAFYVVGLILACWAVVVSALAISRGGDFPSGKGARGGIVAFSALLVVATCASAVITA